MIVSEYFCAWLRDKAPALERSTYEAYTVYLDRHICPYFDALGKSLEALRPLDIRDYVTAKCTGGRLDGRGGGLSASSVRKLRVGGTLSEIFGLDTAKKDSP